MLSAHAEGNWGVIGRAAVIRKQIKPSYRGISGQVAEEALISTESCLHLNQDAAQCGGLIGELGARRRERWWATQAAGAWSTRSHIARIDRIRSCFVATKQTKSTVG